MPNDVLDTYVNLSGTITDVRDIFHTKVCIPAALTCLCTNSSSTVEDDVIVGAYVGDSVTGPRSYLTKILLSQTQKCLISQQQQQSHCDGPQQKSLMAVSLGQLQCFNLLHCIEFLNLGCAAMPVKIVFLHK